jgi:O-antigen/teichoic acid export membrane protein
VSADLEPRSRAWARQGTWSVLDQAVFSISNFAASVLLARWLAPDGFGAWAVAFALLTFLAQIQTAAVLDPMGTLGTSHFASRLNAYLGAQLPLHGLWAVAAGLALALGALPWWGTPLGRACGAVGLGLPLLLAPWTLRRVFYVLGRPAISAFGSMVYAFVLLGALHLVHRAGLLSAASAFWTMAFAGAASTLVMVLCVPAPQDTPVPLREVVLQHWHFGRWLLAASLLVALASQAPVLLAGHLLGLREAGALRAMHMLSQPMLLSITALSALAVPEMSASFARGDEYAVHRVGVRLSSCLLAAALAFEVLLVAFPHRVASSVYGSRFANEAVLLPWLGLIPVILAGTAGAQAAFQATRRPWSVLVAASAWAPATLLLGAWLTVTRGLAGTVWASLLGYVVFAVVVFALYRRPVHTAQARTA